MYTCTDYMICYSFTVLGSGWNSTGSVLAVAYGRFDHQDWCSHKVNGLLYYDYDIIL